MWCVWFREEIYKLMSKSSLSKLVRVEALLLTTYLCPNKLACLQYPPIARLIVLHTICELAWQRNPTSMYLHNVSIVCWLVHHTSQTWSLFWYPRGGRWAMRLGGECCRATANTMEGNIDQAVWLRKECREMDEVIWGQWVSSSIVSYPRSACLSMVSWPCTVIHNCTVYRTINSNDIFQPKFSCWNIV